MKKYNRVTKKHEEEASDIKLAKRELCRGQKPHDYLLVLPEYVDYDTTYKFNPEAYYELLDELDKFEDDISARIAGLGVKSRYARFKFTGGVSRHYICSVCKKKHQNQLAYLG